MSSSLIIECTIIVIASFLLVKPPPSRQSAVGEPSPVQLTGVQHWEQEQPQPKQLTIIPSAPPISCSETEIMPGSSSSAPVMCMNRRDCLDKLFFI